MMRVRAIGVFDRFSRWATNHLGRRVTSGAVIAEIDGLRFISIAAVVFFHLSGYVAAKNVFSTPVATSLPATAWFFGVGNRGVELFFVISGFVLALPFASYWLGGPKRPQLKKYFLRRLTRLEPPYVIALSILLFLVATATPRSLTELLPHYFAGLIYGHNILYQSANEILPGAWSLEVEVQFYVAAPLLALVFRLRSSTSRLVAIFVFGLSAVLVRQYVPGRNTIFHFLEYFMVGFALAEFYLVLWRRRPERDYVWDAIAAATVAAFLLLAHGEPRLLQRLGLPVCALLFAVAAFRSRLLNRILRARLIVVIGGMCYTIYLLHTAVISAVGRITNRFVTIDDFTLALLAQSILIIPSLIFICGLYFAAIERPCMQEDWTARLVSRLGIGRRAEKKLLAKDMVI